MAWSTLCLMMIGGLCLALGLRIASGRSRARAARRSRRQPTWSDIGDLSPFVCHRCGALNLISGAGVGPEGITVRCTRCDERAHVHPPPPVLHEPLRGARASRSAAPTR